jgi:hypothetical protein
MPEPHLVPRSKQERWRAARSEVCPTMNQGHRTFQTSSGSSRARIWFTHCGIAELKGVPGEWRLFAAVSPRSNSIES